MNKFNKMIPGQIWSCPKGIRRKVIGLRERHYVSATFYQFTTQLLTDQGDLIKDGTARWSADNTEDCEFVDTWKIEASKKTKVDPGELTTDDWSYQYPDLIKDLETHLYQYAETPDDIYPLRRLIFVSIRQHLGDKLDG